MHFRRIPAVVGLVFIGTAAAQPMAAQSPAASAAPALGASVMQSLIQDVAQAERKITGLAEAIPESDFGWRPGDGVRSVSEVLMHVAADNYFVPTAAGVDAPASTGIRGDSYPSAQAFENRQVSKEQALGELRASFEHLNQAMRGVDDSKLGDRIDLFGTQVTNMDLWVLATTHLHEHLGQLIAYARSNGVVPPWSQ